MAEKNIAVGLISGGLDSAVLAAHMDSQYDSSVFVFCEYGQKTEERERRAFNELCDYYQPDIAEVVDMHWLRAVGSSGLFEPGLKLDGSNRSAQYVPFRNASLLAAGVALAETVEASALLIGSNAEDSTCPDNSPEFIDAYQNVIDLGTMTERPIQIDAPLLHFDKKQIIDYGNSLEAPFAISWSCHNNTGDVACGGCSNCTARRTAFTELGYVDPIRYEDEV